MIQNIYCDQIDTQKDIIIDIRRESEFMQTGIIKNSYTLTFFEESGDYDLLSWIKEFKRIVKNEDTKFILVCAHAHRTDMIGNYLSSELKYKNAFHLAGGISQWLLNSRETQEYKR